MNLRHYVTHTHESTSLIPMNLHHQCMNLRHQYPTRPPRQCEYPCIRVSVYPCIRVSVYTCTRQGRPDSVNMAIPNLKLTLALALALTLALTLTLTLALSLSLSLSLSLTLTLTTLTLRLSRTVR